MPYIFLLLFSILVTACTTDGTTTPAPTTSKVSVTTATPVTHHEVSTTPIATTTSTVIEEPTATISAPISTESYTDVSLPQTEQTDDIDDLRIIPENTIVGKYILKQGSFSHGAIFQNISEGYLVIEELDPNNYGYYYVTIIDKMSPETQSGIFYKKDGKFVQKVIYDEENPDTHTKKSHISIIDNLDITQDGDILKINIDSTKKQRMVWERDDGVQQPSPKLLNALQEARQDYFEFYKKKCLNKNVECTEISYTPVND